MKDQLSCDVEYEVVWEQRAEFYLRRSYLVLYDHRLSILRAHIWNSRCDDQSSMATHRTSQDPRWAPRLQLCAAINSTTASSPFVPDHTCMDDDDDDTLFMKNDRIRKHYPSGDIPYVSFFSFCRSRYNYVAARLHLLSYMLGILCGVLLTLFIQPQLVHVRNLHRFDTTTTAQSIHHSTFQFLTEVPALESQSHTGILKQSLILPLTAVHPDLVGISVATIRPGQVVSMHVHETMHEFFYILQGAVEITVQVPVDDTNDRGRYPYNQTTTHCGHECFFHASPGEAHAFAVPSDAHVETKMIMLQLAVQSVEVR
jgi:mannose-6-phosphate isomerase-like protein (cupin superfamily)